MIDERDIKEESFRSGDRGVNQSDNAVRLTHIPTGISAQCGEHVSIRMNRVEAMRRLEGLLKNCEHE